MHFLRFLAVFLIASVWNTGALLAQRVVSPVVPRAPQTSDEAGKSVLKHDVASGDEFAAIIRMGCPIQDSYVSCGQILAMFQEAPNLQRYGINSLEKLVEYLEEDWEVVRCVPGKRATMYRVLLDARSKATRLAADWERPCRMTPDGPEKWLADRETGEIIVSLWCGNVIANSEPGAVAQPPSVIVTPTPVSQGVMFNAHVVDSARIRVVDTAGYVYEKLIMRDTTFQLGNSTGAFIVSRSPVSVRTPIGEAKRGSFMKSKKLWIPLALLVGGAVGYWYGQENFEVIPGGCPSC